MYVYKSHRPNVRIQVRCEELFRWLPVMIIRGPARPKPGSISADAKEEFIERNCL